jgi:hypothetical protein
MDLHLYINTNEKSKQHSRSINQDEFSHNETQKRLIGYVSIISLSSTVPNESEGISRPELRLTAIPTHSSSTKHHRMGDFGKTKTFLSFLFYFFFR